MLVVSFRVTFLISCFLYELNPIVFLILLIKLSLISRYVGFLSSIAASVLESEIGSTRPIIVFSFEKSPPGIVTYIFAPTANGTEPK